MIEAARCRERQIVRALQSRPAIGAADELLRQAEFQLGMTHEVRELGNAERLRAVIAHGKRVAVVEP